MSDADIHHDLTDAPKHDTHCSVLKTVRQEYRWGGETTWRHYEPLFPVPEMETRDLVSRQDAEAIIKKKDDRIRELEFTLNHYKGVRGVNTQYSNALANLGMTEDDDPETFADDINSRISKLEEDINEKDQAYKDMESTLNAWFDTEKNTEDRLNPLLLSAAKRYLRTCASGGMPQKLIDDTLPIIESMIAAGVFSESVTQYIMSLRADGDDHRDQKSLLDSNS